MTAFSRADHTKDSATWVWRGTVVTMKECVLVDDDMCLWGPSADRDDSKNKIITSGHVKQHKQHAVKGYGAAYDDGRSQIQKYTATSQQ